jgi:hypothetical protein
MPPVELHDAGTVVGAASVTATEGPAAATPATVVSESIEIATVADSTCEGHLLIYASWT